jgi:hypothetical protein
VLAVEAPSQESVLDKHVKPVAEDVRRRSGVAPDLGESSTAEQHLAHDKQRPAISNDLERTGDRAVLIGEWSVGHIPIID